VSKTTLDVEYARKSVEAARQCRDLTEALQHGKDRWGEVEPLIRALEAHLQSSSLDSSVAVWELVVALLRVLDCDHRMRAVARTTSGGITEEKTRLVVLLQELGECLASDGTESLQRRFDGTYSLDPVRVDPKAALELLMVLPLPTLYYPESRTQRLKKEPQIVSKVQLT
jgi:hypothetical protein